MVCRFARWFRPEDPVEGSSCVVCDTEYSGTRWRRAWPNEPERFEVYAHEDDNSSVYAMWCSIHLRGPP
jgi:hypothetical protein